jgi:hypothetical protein
LSNNIAVNTSGIAVNSASGNVALLPTISRASINIGGTSYSSLVTESVNTQIFTANGTWVKPSWANTGNELVIVHMWGGGGGGWAYYAIGGGGGAFVFGHFKASQCNATCNVVVGVGGSNDTDNINNTTNGGNSIFYPNTSLSLTAYGGGRATALIDGWGGAGGGWFGAGSSNTAGGPLGGTSAASGTDSGASTFGGGGSGWSTFGGTFKNGNSSIYGGGGGAGGFGSPGNSVFGGGGGSSITAVGSSVYGGAGGNNTVASSAPGGGGGGNTSFYSNGARGEVRVYTLRYVNFTPLLVGQTLQVDATNSATTIEVTLPSGIQPGDLIVVFTADGDGRNNTPGNANFNLVTNIGTGNSGCALYWKIASGSEPASYTFTLASSAARLVAVCMVFRYASFGAASAAVKATTTTLGLGGIVLPSGPKILVAAVGGRSLGSYSDLAGYTTLYKDTDGTIPTYFVAYKITNDDGDTGTVTVTNSTTGDHSGTLFYVI